MDDIHEFTAPGEGSARPTGELLTGYSYIEPTDVAYAKVTPCFENGKGLVGSVLEEPVFATTELTVLRPSTQMNQRFLAYVLQSAQFREPAIASMTGAGGLKRVDESEMKDLRVPAPSVPVQRQIADYLDHETAEIDAFIEEQESLLHLTQERAAAALTFLVTGTDGSAGKGTRTVPWAPTLGTPHPVVNIRRVASMRTGHTPSRQRTEYWKTEDLTIPWFTLADVWQLRRGNKYLGETESKISELGLANSAAELLPAGTVVLSRTASVGFTGIMPIEMATSQDYWNWVCGDALIPEYLWMQFRAMKPEFDRLKSGSTHKTIYQADAAAMMIVLPNLETQDKIIAAATDQDDEIHALQELTHHAVELARERRAALISAAVTGQIDVTGRRRGPSEAERLEEALASSR